MISLNRTYVELRLSAIVSFSDIAATLNRTYVELRHNQPTTFHHRVTSLNRTYVELRPIKDNCLLYYSFTLYFFVLTLKPSRRFNIDLAQRLSIVPMWN